MSEYDLNVILEPGLSETQLQAEKDAIMAQIERAGAEFLNLDEWGSRRLSYPIRKHNEGYYLIYRLKLSGETPKTVEAALRLRDNVMRVLVVKDRPEWKSRKVKESAQPAEAPAA